MDPSSQQRKVWFNLKILIQEYMDPNNNKSIFIAAVEGEVESG